MTKSLLKNTLREIKNSKARFISILAIIALGVGFLSGIRATVPSMYSMAENYFSENNLHDFRLVSTTGFDEDDISAVAALDEVTSVMPSYYADLVISDNSGGSVVRVIALPEEYNDNEALSTPLLKEGRLPEKKGEILVEYSETQNSVYKIGDTITFSEESGENSAEDMVSELEYTIVGTVQSPAYISYQRGSTNIGNGNIDCFMYISSDDFVYERYTELYVQTKYSENGDSPFSDEYKKSCEDISTVLEDVADLRCEVFNTDVIGKAKQELEEAKEEYEEKKSEAEKELEDAKSELESGEEEYNTKIAGAATELEDAKSKIESGWSELETAKQEYYAGIEEGESIILSGEEELSSGEIAYNSAKEEFDIKINTAQTEITNGILEYETALKEFEETQKPLLVSGISQAEEAVNNLRTLISVTTDEQTIELLNAQLTETESTYNELNLQLTEAETKLAETKTTLQTAQAELDLKKSEGEAQLSAVLTELETAAKQLETGKAELELKKTEGLSQLITAENELNSAQSEYEEGLETYNEEKESGKKKIEEGWEEYNSAKAEAEEEFRKAEGEIKEAEEEIENIAEPEWYVFDRDDNPGYSTYSQNIGRLEAVAAVFPVFFLLVAVLVCVTTISRLVEEKRTEVGILKALGYSNFSIVMKFVIYALLAGILGSVVGLLAGLTTLPFIIYNAYQTMYCMPDITLVPDIPSVIISVAAAILCTVIVSVAVCMKSLRQKPAKILRPKSPKAGKRILLEKIKPLWSHMSFSSKLTSRNLFRYKSRLFMTVIGIAGCTALIVAAFGLKDSFVPLTNDQFENIYKYDVAVVPEEGGSEQELEYLTEKVTSSEYVQSSMLISQNEAVVSSNGVIKDESTYLIVMQNPDEFDSLVSLRTRKEKTPLALSDEYVLISEKMAEELSVGAGDFITVEVDSKSAEVKVGGVFEQYVSNYVYITPELYSEVFGDDVKYNIVNAVLNDKSEEAQDKFGENMISESRIAAVSFIDSSVMELDDMLNSLNLVVFVMVIFAAALAFVVLYNLTNINIAERVREIATFKVLGFYNKETSNFIYRENIVLTLLGIVAGLILGIFLTDFVIQTIEVDNVMFGRDIYPLTFVYATGLTAIFAAVVNFVMGFKLRAINMVESLKSIE